jgi:hypothetical protein
MAEDTNKPGSDPLPASPETETPEGSPRKPYSSPKVRAYGNIREITLGTGHLGAKDGAPGSFKTGH